MEVVRPEINIGRSYARGIGNRAPDKYESRPVSNRREQVGRADIKGEWGPEVQWRGMARRMTVGSHRNSLG